MFYSYDELKNLMININIKSKQNYISLNKNNYDKKIPSNPDTFYNEWENWSIFLNKPICKKKHYNVYYNYLDCIEKVKLLNIKSKQEWCDKIKNIILNDNAITYNPSEVYKNEWENWSIFLSIDEKQKQSTGERLIIEILDELNVNYIYNKTFRDCKYIGKLRFDFRIKLNNTYLLLKYDGELHFVDKKLHKINDFQNTLLRDNAKNKWS